MLDDINKIKLCFITAFPPQKKGEAEYVKNYVDYLSKFSGTQSFIHILAQKRSNQSAKTCSSLKQSKGLKLDYVYDPENLLDRNLCFLKFFLKIVIIRPDLVHLTYGPNTDYGGRMGEPLILLFILLKLLNVPVIVTLHSTWLPRDVEDRAVELGHGKLVSKFSKLYFSIFTRVFTTFVDKVLLLTSEKKSQLTDEYVKSYNLPRKKIDEELHGCIFNSKNFINRNARIKAAKEKIDLKDKKLVLSFGFIRRDKGFEHLLVALSDVLSRINNAVLLIAGSPKSNQDKLYLNYLRNLKKKLGLDDAVIFDTRYIPEESLVDYIKAADVIVFPLTRNVGASGPLHQAISFGVPIIACNVGYMSVLKNVVLSVQPKDSSELSRLLINILSNDELVQKQLSSELRYAESHDWIKVVSKNFFIYKSVIK